MPTFKPRDFLKSSAPFRIYNNIEDNIIDNIFCIVVYTVYMRLYHYQSLEICGLYGT